MVDHAAPAGTVTEPFAWLATAMAVGGAVGAASAGILADRASAPRPAPQRGAARPSEARRSMKAPVGYLVTVAIVALCTLLALAPARRPWALGLLSYLCAQLVCELPFLFLYYLIASTALAASEGAGAATAGWLAFGVAGLTVVGLGLVARRGRQARPALNRALAEGLGANWRAAIDPERAARLRSSLPYPRILFAPFLVRRRDVEHVRNIRYGDAGRRNRLDVYRHRSHPSGGPVLVHLHGGAMFTGRKDREARPLIYRFASQGWVCISANYRLRPAATFPDQLIDVKRVIAWVRANAHEYGADPSTVLLVGSSSGGQLAALAALTPNDQSLQPGFEPAQTSFTAVVCLHTYYGQEPSPSSPFSYPATEAPPFLLVHGDQDTVVPVQMARRFAETLRRGSSNPIVYAELPGGQHGFDRFHSLRFESVVNAVEAFAAWIHSRDDSDRPGHTTPF
jgi:acetyl esterase/lipase